MNILFVDDEPGIRRVLGAELRRKGHQVTTCENASQAITEAARAEYDVILLDIRMPGMDGIQAMDALRQAGSDGEVVVLTGRPSVNTAVDAMKRGAYDYLMKPVKTSELLACLEKAYARKLLRCENRRLRRMVKLGEGETAIIGDGEAMRAVMETVRRVAGSDSTVLIEGESGTGKELIARAIHDQSHRAEKPYVTIHCAALQANMLESELFGHSRGAFTGAHEAKEGLLEVADGGTVFLDEIAELPAEVQAKLLRFLETRETRRLGATSSRYLDVRLISATNRDLAAAVREGGFREDLFYRVKVVTINMPPLRERLEDMGALVQHFLKGTGRGLTLNAVALLQQYHWPGNVRELQNVLERAVVLTDAPELDAHCFERLIREDGSESRLSPAISLAEVERRHITSALEHFDGDKPKTAESLEISLKTLYNKLHTYNIEL